VDDLIIEWQATPKQNRTEHEHTTIDTGSMYQNESTCKIVSGTRNKRCALVPEEYVPFCTDHCPRQTTTKQDLSKPLSVLTVETHNRVANPTSPMEKDSRNGKLHTILMSLDYRALARVDFLSTQKLQLGHSPGVF
jgi:hypothetical protein